MTVSESEKMDDGSHQQFPTVSFLQMVKDAQQKHGLRHGDYFRYKKYCTAKLRRVRRALKFTHQHKCLRKSKAKFTARQVNADNVTDVRFFELLAFEVERRWADAMHNKQLAGEDSDKYARKRHAARTSFKRAAKLAANLDQVVRACVRCNASTKLESQAYATWLHGILGFETGNFVAAKESLSTARKIYDSLATATANKFLQDVYKAKCSEIRPQLRLCEMNASGTSTGDLQELLDMRLQLSDPQDVEKLLDEMRANRSADGDVKVEWAGRVEQVTDARVVRALRNWKQSGTELASCSSADQKVAVYERHLAETRDALDAISELSRRHAADGLSTDYAQFLKGFLDFVRMSKTAERYLLLIDIARLDANVKPQELLRLYDSVIEIYKEAVQLPGLAPNFSAVINANIRFYRAFRCYYMARAYASQEKWTESLALLKRAAERATEAARGDEQSAVVDKDWLQINSPTKDSTRQLSESIEAGRVSVHSSRYGALLKDATKKSGAAADVDDNNRPLSETLDECRLFKLQEPEVQQAKKPRKSGDVVSNSAPVARFPPPLQSMPAKPAFFDLAINHIRMTNLDDRLAELQAIAPSPRQGASPQKSESGGQRGGQDESIAGKMSNWFWGKK